MFKLPFRINWNARLIHSFDKIKMANVPPRRAFVRGAVLQQAPPSTIKKASPPPPHKQKDLYFEHKIPIYGDGNNKRSATELPPKKDKSQKVIPINLPDKEGEEHSLGKTQIIINCVLITLSIIFFLGLVVYIVYDLSVNGRTGISSSTSNVNVNHPTDPKNGIVEKSGNGGTVDHKTFIKIITPDSIKLHEQEYKILQKYKNNLEMYYKFYDLDNSAEGSTYCEPILSSIEVTCCCFLENMDHTICNGDEPLIIEHKIVDDTDSSQNEEFVSMAFYLSCNVVHTIAKAKRSSSPPPNITTTNKRNIRFPLVKFGLSKDYINNTIINESQNECTIKMNVLCVIN